MSDRLGSLLTTTATRSPLPSFLSLLLVCVCVGGTHGWMVEVWLDYLRSSTRRFYIFSLSPARPPYCLYLSPPSPSWDLREC